MSQVVPAAESETNGRIFPQHCCSWQNTRTDRCVPALIADPGFGDQAIGTSKQSEQTRVDAHCSREHKRSGSGRSSNHSGNPCRRTMQQFARAARTALGYRAIKFVSRQFAPTSMTRRLNTSVFLQVVLRFSTSCNNAAAHKTSCFERGVAGILAE